MRVTLVLPDLGLGGTQRVVLALAQSLAGAGWEIHIVTISDLPPLYTLPANVHHHALAPVRSRGGLANVLRLLRLHRQLRVLRPDAVLSFLTTANVLAILAGLGQPWRTIVSERSDIRYTPMPRLWAKARTLVYGLADVVVAQTETAAGPLRRLSRRVRVIPNAVPPFPHRPEPVQQEPLVLAVGRLEEEKCFDLLLTAFARLADRFPQWRLQIAGEGSRRQQLETQASLLGITGRVTLSGYAADPAALYARASVFVLSSRFEGFPNALCEAMAAGLAVIATDCPSGPADIVRNDVDGVLIPTQDVDALEASLQRMLEDTVLRQRLGNEARRIVERYSSAEIAGRWQQLLTGIHMPGPADH